MGSTPFALGGASVVALLIAQGNDWDVWDAWWFRIALGASIVLLALGGYAFLGNFFALPLLPRPREEEESAALTTSEGGETITEGGSVTGYDRVAETRGKGSKSVFRGTRIRKR